MTWELECRGIGQRFGSREVLNDINWRLPPETIAGLVGPSGAGKSTLLRILAGLDAVSHGQVQWRPTSGQAAQPRIGMVFQNLSLWPHLTATEHLQCVLPSQQRSAHQANIQRLFQDVQLPESVWSHYPAQLSGGEAQRLALTRALASCPDVLLMDEPLAQLDDNLRNDLLALVHSVAADRRMSVVYVSHSWSEVAQLCSQAAVLSSGRLVQAGSIDDLYWRPAELASARLTGSILDFPTAMLALGAITIMRQPGKWPSLPWMLGDATLARPQQLQLVEPTDENQWSIIGCRAVGLAWRLEVTRGGHSLLLSATRPWPLGAVVGISLLLSPL